MSLVGEFAEKVVLGVITTLITSALIITVTKIATKMSFGQIANGIVRTVVLVKDVVIDLAKLLLDRLLG